jgi:hypothetical protein
MTHRRGAWRWAWEACVVLTLVACGTPDNGGVDISFGPSSVSSTAPVTTIGEDESSSDAGESSGMSDDPETSSDPLPPTDATDWSETSESSGALDDESSSDGGDAAAVDCVGLDEATCGVTPGCGWPIDNDFFGMTSGPCAWDPLACAAFDQLSCTTSPACVFNLICMGVSCETLDELACPTVMGCVWIVDFGGGGCLG